MGGCDWPVSYYTSYFSLFPPPLPPALGHRVVAVPSPVWNLLRVFGGVSRRRDCLHSQHIKQKVQKAAEGELPGEFVQAQIL